MNTSTSLTNELLGQLQGAPMQSMAPFPPEIP